MSTKNSSNKALEYLVKARLSIKGKDANSASEFARKAVDLDPNLEEAWLILASVSSPDESVKYLDKALEINPESKKARAGMRWAARQLREIQASLETDTHNEKTKKARTKPKKERWGLSLFFIVFSIGCVMLLWFGLPAIQAQASIKQESRPGNALPKPTLTPTATPTPTQTPTPTPTSTPTPTPTQVPTYTPDTDFASYYYHSWDIPEEVSGTNDLWIEIDLSAQMLHAYRGDQIINSFLVSTGTSSHPTVTGAYKIYAKYTAYTMIGPDYHLADVPFSMFFHKGYSIHGTYWHDNFGTPMSHGCVNMKTNDAAWLYDLSTIGTYVFVHY